MANSLLWPNFAPSLSFDQKQAQNINKLVVPCSALAAPQQFELVFLRVQLSALLLDATRGFRRRCVSVTNLK